jgi:AbiJ N-terminal domain 5
MNESRSRNKKILGLKRAIEATFDDARWQELGYLTDTVEIITGHPRLLRSLYWGDSDYPGCIITVLPQIIARAEENLNHGRLRWSGTVASG